MKNKNRIWISVLMGILMLVLTLGLVSCKQPQNPTNYGEIGTYYFDAEFDEYQISLDGARYSLNIGDELATGVYSFDGTTLKLYKADSMKDVKEDETPTIPATLDDNVLTITYNDGTYRFLKKVTYTVSFEVDGATVNPVSVVNGKTLSKPTEPTKAGQVFLGWFVDATYQTPFAFDSAIITSNTTLYGRFVAKEAGATEYVATMMVDGQRWNTQNTVGGVLYNLPTPQKTDATFVGWWVSDYQSAQKLTYQYEGQKLTQNLNLYAVWNTDKLQVSVDSTGVYWNSLGAGVEYSVEITAPDGSATVPYKTTSLSYEYDFASKTEGDFIVTITAKGETYQAYYKNKALDRVSIFTVAEPSILVFSGVANADKYYVTIECGNAEHSHTMYDNGNSTNFNFANCDMKEGGITFVVTAKANGYASSTSETFVYNRVLGEVVNVKYDANNGKLTWSPVQKATGYEVTVTTNGTTTVYTVNGTELSMVEYTGDVNVAVKAVAKGYNSAIATELSFNNAKISAPVVSVNYNTVKWNAVQGATAYNVKVGSKVYNVTADVTSFEIPEEYQIKGMVYEVSVQAVGATEANNSYYSKVETVKYAQFESVVYANSKLTWKAVGGAYSYGIRVNAGAEMAIKGGETSASVTFTRAGINNVTLYAYDFNYRVLDYKVVDVYANEIIFDVRGGESVDPIYKAVGDELTLPETTSTGYTFAGWYNVPGGPSSNGAKYDDKVYQGNGTMMLYAYWTPNPYQVTLKAGRLVFNEETQTYETVYETIGVETVYYNQKYTLPIADAYDLSKVFGGWFEDDSDNSLQFTNPLGEGNGKWIYLSDYTLYAGWIDILGYELINDGEAYQVVAGEGTKYVKEVTIPEIYVDPDTKVGKPVIAIASGAFASCTQIETINIPDTIESIYIGFGSYLATGSAFYDCRGLKNINVYCVDGSHDQEGDDVRHDHQTYFSSVDGMLIRHASPNVETLDRGVELYYVPYNRTGTLVVPDCVEHITTRSLYGLRFNKAIIPASVTYIGDYVFYSGYYNSIIFEQAPAGVEEKPLEIGENTFNNLTSLTYLELPARIGAIDFNETHMFDYAPALKDINIVGRAPADMSEYYSSIDGVVVSGDKSELVYYPKSRVGEYTIPVEIQVIASKAFYNCRDLTKVIIPDNVLLIEQEAFLNCVNLKEVEFKVQSGSLEIESRAFYGCEKIASIVLPSTLKKIGSNAFGGAKALLTVTMECGEIELAEKVFADDDGKAYVTTLNIGPNVSSFEINNVFFGCKLFALNVDKTNTNFNVDQNGVLYNADTTAILYYPYGLTIQYEIPDTVKEIGEGVFEGRGGITSIVIKKSVTRIGKNAFKDCVALNSLIFEEERTEDLVIEANAFEGCLALTTVTLPEKTVSVGDSAFKNCTNLERVHVPATLTAIGSSIANALLVFEGCNYLEEITVAEANTAFANVDGMFAGKTNGEVTALYFAPEGLTGEVVIPSTVTTIGANLFAGHKGVTKVSFENNTASDSLVLGASMFENAKALVEVRLPNGLKVIPAKLFMGSTVQTIFVPNTVTTINTQAFANCEKLTTLTFEEGNDNVALTFTAATSATTSAFSGTKKLATIKLPDRTASITNYMFAGSYVQNLTLPANATSIGQYAFANCKGLTNFVMPNSITTLGNYAFVGCVNLTTITLSENLTTIPQYAFAKATIGGGIGGLRPSPGSTSTTYEAAGITSIHIPAKVTKIDNYAFDQCKDLKTITFAENGALTTLGNYVFRDSGLTAITLPNTVTTVGTYTFAGCANLKTVVLSENMTTISNYMFAEVPESNSLFSEVPYSPPVAIESIVIPANITTINQYAFRNVVSLKSITFAEGSKIKSIGNYAFMGTGLTSFTLPETADASGKITFGTSIFQDCKSLKEVSLPKSVTALNGAFVGCVLTKLEMANDGDGDLSNDVYNVDSENGVVYNGDRNTIQLYFGIANEFVVPEGVHTIEANAFAGNTTLTKITFPSTLQVIKASAFSMCSNLLTIVAPQNIALTTIGDSAFAQSGLKSIVLPPSITSMGQKVFQKCTNLETAVVYTAVLGQYMFDGCTALKEVTLSDNTTAIPAYTFQDCASLKSFTLPSAVKSMGNYCLSGSGITSFNIHANISLGQYMFEDCWDLTTVTMDDNYASIPAHFLQSSGVTKFTLPSKVTSIGDNAFLECENLEEFIVPASVTTLNLSKLGIFSRSGLKSIDLSHVTNLTLGTNGYHFGYCSNLTTVKLPDSVTTIPKYMFRECFALETIEAKNVTEISEYAFEKCYALKEFVFNANLTTIGQYAFSNCTGLTKANLPDSLVTLGACAFYKCTALREVELGNSLTSIGKQAFAQTALVEVYIPASVTSIGEQAFYQCYDLVSILVDSASTSFYSGEYGELYNSFNQLLLLPTAATGDNGYVEMRPGTSIGAT